MGWFFSLVFSFIVIVGLWTVLSLLAYEEFFDKDRLRGMRDEEKNFVYTTFFLFGPGFMVAKVGEKILDEYLGYWRKK